ncbi:MAG: PepSY domain-containing protein [Mesorhizobium sp.]|nr:PepSY domain-containing protein [Mesorhizobium sp.]
MLKIVSAAAVTGLLLAGSAYAQDANRVPPPDGKKLSEIISKVEQRDGFRYISDVDWDDGAYEVTYYTTDKAKVEIRFDAVTGEPK